MRNETPIVRASKIAAKRIDAAIERTKAQILDSFAQQGNLSRVVGKKYEDLTPEEIQSLASIYHSDEEPFPCVLCRWIAAEEMKLLRRGK